MNCEMESCVLDANSILRFVFLVNIHTQCSMYEDTFSSFRFESDVKDLSKMFVVCSVFNSSGYIFVARCILRVVIKNIIEFLNGSNTIEFNSTFKG